MLGFGALLVVLPGAALLRIAVTPHKAAFERTVAMKITSSGKAMKAALSPDGRSVAYAPLQSGLESLNLRETGSVHDVELIPPSKGRYIGVTFSPDGTKLYYVIRNARTEAGSLYSIPVTGGPTRKLKENLESAVTLSPDGKRYAFVRESDVQSAIVIADVGSGVERTLYSRPAPQVLDYPAWSPDGRTIACATFDSSATAPKAQILKIRIEDGTASLLSRHVWGFIHEMSWLADGHGIVVNARAQDWYPFHQWLVSLPGDTLRKLTDGLNSEWGASLSGDSHELAMIEEMWLSSLWRVSPARPRDAMRLVINVTGKSLPVWLPGGGILFEQDLNGASTLWTVQSDGANQRPFPLPPEIYHTAASRDGKHFAFVSSRGGRPGIWTIAGDGSGALKVSDAPGWFPDISPDGKWVVYAAPGPRYWTALWRVGFRGGARSILNDNLWQHPVISPDGKWIAGFYTDQRLTPQTEPGSMAVTGIEGGRPSKIFPITRTVSIAAGLRWTPDGRALTYVASGKEGDNVWIQPLDGSLPRQITELTAADAIFGFDWSADGEQLVFSRGVQSRDIVLMRDAGQK